MEINQIYNRKLKEEMVNASIGILRGNNLVTPEEFAGLGVGFGYLFTTEEGQIEGLFQVAFSGKTFYFAAQKGKLMLVNINDAQYQQTIEYMKSNHPCILSDELPETDLQKQRRIKNNQIVASENITVAEKLMTHWNDDEVVLKDIRTICKRAIACFFAIQIACDINNNNYEEGLRFFKPKLEKFAVLDQLNSTEKRIIDGTYSMQDAADIDWAYEALWSLCWSLGFVEDISDASQICDCDMVINLFMSCNTVDDLVNKSSLRSKEEILDALDLHMRYNWAVNESKVNPDASIGDLNPEIVIERRRGLEWIVADEDDWYDLLLEA